MTKRLPGRADLSALWRDYRITVSMTDEELDREHAALMAEHAELEAEHQKLEGNPKNIDAHVVHAARLHAHMQRLHAYMEARGYRSLSARVGPR